MKTRIISAIVLCAILVPILAIGGLPFKILAIILGVMSMYEMIKTKAKKVKIPKGISIISYILVGTMIALGSSVYAANYEIIYQIMIVLFLIYFLPVIFVNDNERYSVNDALYLLGSTLFIGVAYNSFVLVYNTDVLYIIYIVLITVLTDTFAYFTGMLIGKTKLCEEISPKKTWEGAIGGTVVGTIISTFFYLYLINPNENVLLIIGVTLLLSIVAQLGDLFFSSIKRQYNIKDFSNLIPGHGGILDRFDSMIFVVITFMLFMSIL